MAKTKSVENQKKADLAVSAARQSKHSGLLTVFFTVLSIFWILPIIIVLLNSFKRKAYIFKNPFGLSSVPISQGFDKWSAGLSKTFVGWLNYGNAVKKTNFFSCFGYSLFITVVSVALIVLCCSMTAWYITRVKNAATKTIYVLCLFSMIVPFQMVMFTLSKFANILHLSTPWGITIIYLGFGAGLSIFMFTGFVKSIPLEIEEAAMIDGCNPPQIFFGVDIPIMKPTIITVAILQSMVERLPSAQSGAGCQQVQDDSDRCTVSEAVPRTDRLGRDDGGSGARHSSDHHLLSGGTEIYH